MLNGNEHHSTDFTQLRENTSLGDFYTLEWLIREEPAGAYFAAHTHRGERVLIKLAPAHEVGPEEQFVRWQRSRQLRHPHLLEMRDAGRDQAAGNDYVYAVFEYPDDVLASACEHGPLSAAETRGVLDAALAALRYLHDQGFVHGAVDPDHIVAIGDTVKLMSDSPRETSDPEARAEDVRQLGELLRTLRAPEPLDGVLESVARHTTGEDPAQRWTMVEIAGALEPPAFTAAVEEAAAPHAPASAPREPNPPLAEISRAPQDATASISAGPHAVERPKRPFPKWIIAGVAALLLTILLLNWRRKPEPPAPPPLFPAATPVTPPVQPRETPPSGVYARNPAQSSPLTWRVVAFTYRSRDAALNKAQRINDRWPAFHASVFAPKGIRGYYLVALGEPMTREDAVRLQKKARRAGLPRDTIVQNYE